METCPRTRGNAKGIRKAIIIDLRVPADGVSETVATNPPKLSTAQGLSDRTAQ
jgi:hypothetical protein